MEAFTVGYSTPCEEDEISAARQTAETLRLDHHVIRIGPADFLRLLPVAIAAVEEPLATTSIVPMFSLASLVSHHVKVVLSGQGTDEALGGYRRYQAELLHDHLPSAAISLLTFGASLLGRTSVSAERLISSIRESDDVIRFEKVYSVFSNDQIERLIGCNENHATDRIRYFYELLNCATLGQSMERMLSIDLRMNLSDDLLLYTDKLTMRHSIECRVPFLDLNLVRFVESLPPNYRASLFKLKSIQKSYAAAVLPRFVRRRKKKGFVSPTVAWFRSVKAIRDLLLDRTSPFGSLFDINEVEKILDEHDKGRNRERQSFLLLSIYHWTTECAKSTRITKAFAT
jgi:asparagine synthase (glutamine-hydrolysing)